MSTKAQITTAIDTKIRNKTPLVVKVEHADVEQLITDEMFPDSVKVEWNGTTAVDPTANVIVSSSITSGNLKFTVYFWKQGNTVYVNGVIENLNFSFALLGMQIITFPTTLFTPLSTSSLRVNLISNLGDIAKQVVFANNSGIYFTDGIPAQIAGSYKRWGFNLTYKVEN